MIFAFDLGDLNPISWVTSTGAEIVEKGFEAAAKALGAGADEMLLTILKAWQAPASDGAARQTTIEALQSKLQPITAGVAVICLIYVAARAAWEANTSGQGRTAHEGARAGFRTLLIGGAGVTLLMAALSLSDAASAALLPEGNPPGSLVDSGISVGLLFMFGMLAIVASVIQIVFITVRGAMIVLLGAVWQLSAASSATETGATVFRRVNGWLLAFVLYKPVAALCYASAYELRKTAIEEGDVLAVVESLVLICLAVVALPALMRLVAPVAALGSGGSVMGVMAGGAAVATGAVMLGGAGGAAAAGAVGGASGGSGAAGAAGGAGAAGPSGAAGGGGGPGASGTPGSPGPVTSPSTESESGSDNGSKASTGAATRSGGASASTDPSPSGSSPPSPVMPSSNAGGSIASGARQMGESSGASPDGGTEE